MPNVAYSQPSCVISGADGIAIDFGARLLSVTLHEEAGFTNNRLDVEVDDSDPGVATPPDGMTVSVSMGYTDPGAQMYDKGQFVFTESERTFNPRALVIRFHAFDTKGSWKSNQQTSYHSTTIGDIMNTVAQRQGVQAAVDPTIAAIQIPHRDQMNQSDMSFVSELAANNGASCNIANNILAVAPRGQTKSISGQDVSSVILSLQDIDTGTHLHQGRGDYGSVSTNYNNQDTGTEQSETATSTTSTSPANSTSAALEPTKEEAQNKSQATSAAMARNVDTFQFTSLGFPQIAAETLLSLDGTFGRNVPTSWLVSQCTQTFKPGEGFKTQGVCELPETAGSSSAATSSSETQPSPAASTNDAGSNDNLGDALTTTSDSNTG